MLKISRTPEGYIEVEETLMNATQTQKRFWYYDLANKVQSSNGQKGEKPNRPMTLEALSWVTKHYLPKCS